MQKTIPTDTPSEAEEPGVPGLRTWRGVYTFVLASFAACVALLALFTAVFNR